MRYLTILAGLSTSAFLLAADATIVEEIVCRVNGDIITRKDLDDLKFGLKNDVDFVALSFGRGKADIINLRKLILKYNPKKF